MSKADVKVTEAKVLVQTARKQTFDMKAISLFVKKLCLRMSLFFNSRLRVNVKNFCTDRKVLSQGIHVYYERQIYLDFKVTAKA